MKMPSRGGLRGVLIPQLLENKNQKWTLFDERSDRVDYFAVQSDQRSSAGLSEQVRMSSCLQKKQCQFCVALLPCHQPIRLYVALPCFLLLANQLVWAILYGQRASGCEQVHCISNEFHAKPSFDAAAEVLYELI